MAEDQNQRPYRSNEAPARVRAPASGSDPLAELARLIGQTDPFAEFGRETPRRAAAPTQPTALEFTPRTSESPAIAPNGGHDYYAAPQAPQLAPPPAAPQSLPPEPQPYAQPNFGRPMYGGAPLNGGNDLYQVDSAPAYQEQGSGYDNDMFRPDGGHDAHDEVYDDVPPSRRRIGIMAIAGVFALAVIGTAGAFGYRAIFGSSGSTSPPPVIKAESAPSKIVPSGATKDASSSKITDRVNDRPAERLVSREEQPVDIKDKVAGGAFPPAQDRQQPNSISALIGNGSGVVGSEPKRVRTIAIHPDGSTAGATASADAMPPQSAPAPVPRVTNVTPAPQPRVAANPPPSAVTEPPPPVQRAAPAAPRPVQHAAAPSNAPLSLNPNAPAPAARPAPPARTASAAPTQLAPSSAAATAHGFAVQVSSQRSEAEAQAAFRALQGKYPAQLGNRTPLIREVNLGEKGTYYRAMVGPFANGSDATALCSSLKAAGGQCIIQKN